MKTKLVTVIAVAFFIMPKLSDADKPTSTINATTAVSPQVDIIVESNQEDSDFSDILSTVESDNFTINEPEFNPGFDISDFIYEEPEVDDLEIDTRAIFKKIMNEKIVK